MGRLLCGRGEAFAEGRGAGAEVSVLIGAEGKGGVGGNSDGPLLLSLFILNDYDLGVIGCEGTVGEDILARRSKRDKVE